MFGLYFGSIGFVFSWKDMIGKSEQLFYLFYIFDFLPMFLCSMDVDFPGSEAVQSHGS